MKKLLWILGLLGLSALPALGQNQQVSGTLTAADSGSCAANSTTAGSAVTLPLNATSGVSVFQLSGTFSATIQFQGSADGANWLSLSAVPTAGGSSVNSATAAGGWQVNVGAFSIVRACASVHASGTVNVVITSSPASAASLAVNQITGSTIYPIFNILAYGGRGDLRTCTVSTNSTTTITAAGANPCAFTAADVGKVAWVMNPSTNAAICGSQTVAESIAAQGGTTATLKVACSATLASTAVAYIGTDNITALQKIATAIIAANGGVGYAPSGNFALAGPASGAAIAFNITPAVTGTVSFKGNGENDTVFFPAPWIRTNSSLDGDVFNFANQSAAVLEDFGLNLYSFGRTNANGNGAVGALYPQADRIAIFNDNWDEPFGSFFSDPTTSLGIPTWFNYSIAQNLQSESVTWYNTTSSGGVLGFDVVASVLTGPLELDFGTGQQTLINVLHGAIFANPVGYAIVVGPSIGTLQNTVNVQGVQMCSNGNSSEMFSEGVGALGGNVTFNVRGITVDAGSCPAAGTNVTDFYFQHSGELLNVSESNLHANGSGYTFNLAGGASAFDLGGNAVAGGTGILTGSGLFNSLSITGTALASGDIALTSGWSTSTVGTISGDSHRGTFTVTLAGTLTSPGVITITFPTSFWIAPQCAMADIGGTNPFATSIATGTVSATSAAFSVTTGTLTPADTMTFQYSCQ